MVFASCAEDRISGCFRAIFLRTHFHWTRYHPDNPKMRNWIRSSITSRSTRTRSIRHRHQWNGIRCRHPDPLTIHRSTLSTIKDSWIVSTNEDRFSNSSFFDVVVEQLWRDRYCRHLSNERVLLSDSHRRLTFHRPTFPSTSGRRCCCRGAVFSSKIRFRPL